MAAHFGLNGWNFCLRHGYESCADCNCEYRAQNNMVLMPFLRERIRAEYIVDEIMGSRKSFKFHTTGRITPPLVWDGCFVVECRQHDQDCCQECFDFNALVLSEWRTSILPAQSQSSQAAPNTSSLLRPEGKGRLTPRQRETRSYPKPLSRNSRPWLAYPDDPRRFAPDLPDATPEHLFENRCDRGVHQSYRYLHEEDDDVMLVYTDGACLDQGDPRRRRAGWSFVFDDDTPQGGPGSYSGPLEGTIGGPEQTSNRAELRAVIAFLQMCEWEKGGMDTFVIATDSEYIVEGMCSRLQNWVSRGWRTANGGPVANRDLWEVLKREVESAESGRCDLRVLFWKIPRGWNGRADRLAKQAANASQRPTIAQPITDPAL